MKKIITLVVSISLVLGTCGLVKNLYDVKLQLQEAQERQEQMQKDNEDLKNKIDEVAKQAVLYKNENEDLKENLNDLQNELDKAKKVAAEASRNLSLSKEFGQKHYDADMNIYQKSGVTAVLLNKAFKGTGLAGMGQAFVDAENETGINALFLVGIAVQESGWGTSDFTYSRQNIFGFGSYDNDTKFTVEFSSKEEGVIKVARALKRDYMETTGEFYHGATPRGVNVKYCSKSDWADNVASIMNTICKRIAK